MTLAIRAMRAAEPKGKSEIISHLPADVSDLRRRIADRIEADIALLDALAGDPDLEDNGDHEPSLGSTDGLLGWCQSGTDDCEQEVVDQPHDEETDKEPSLCGITVDACFANGTDEGEPSLGSLGGTAAGCEQSQKGWDKGDRKDREVDGGSRVHTQDGLWRDPGAALTAVKDRLRNLRRPRQRGSIQVAGPNSNVYNVQPWGRR
ncbi:hypothetical protein [Methylobacterium sp. J-067]|uniref:hypothetical protein n=1 Tax=Methylobacterium sp. J-067 TaxID=2836648 RepID=UPI001FB92767|nr:hypothetical protein [Methylobacterium sp. J-067]MCJ2025100.1 hypothetical protein [Methylobacterium sp. J-067]